MISGEGGQRGWLSAARTFDLVGCNVLHVTSRRLARDFPGVVREVRMALASRRWRP